MREHPLLMKGRFVRGEYKRLPQCIAAEKEAK